MRPFRIRKATLRDLETLVGLRRRMWEDMGYRDRRLLDEADRTYRAWARQRLRSRRLIGFLVETDEGRAVAGGCVWLVPVQPRPGNRILYEPYLLSMHTDPRYRRRGLASRIVREAIAWSRAHGYPRISLHASRKGRGVYKRLGFVRSSEMFLVLKK